MFRPLLFETLRVPAPDSYRTPPGVTRENLCRIILEKLERVLAEHHRRIAALVIEPLVQAAAGMIMHPPGYLRGVRELTRKYDVLLIADEVAVGFGRTGRMFACEHEKVTPDLLCLAKGFDRRIPADGRHAGHRGDLAGIPGRIRREQDVLSRPHLRRQSAGRGRGAGHAGRVRGGADAGARCRPKIARLGEHLARIARLPHVGDVRQCGLIAAVELVRDVATKEPYPWEERRGLRVCDHARREGVWLRPLGNVIVIMPPLSVTLEQLDQIAGCIVERGILLATQ